MVKRLIKNCILCKKCGDIIESKHVHDFQRCSCGRIFIDGGLEYSRRGYVDEDDIYDLCEYEYVSEAEIEKEEAERRNNRAEMTELLLSDDEVLRFINNLMAQRDDKDKYKTFA